MIAPMAAVIAFAIEHSLIQDSLHSTDNCHMIVDLAFVKIVVNSCCAVVPALVPATDATQLKCIRISELMDDTECE